MMFELSASVSAKTHELIKEIPDLTKWEREGGLEKKGENKRPSRSPSMHLHVTTTMDGKEWREGNGKWQKSWTLRPGSSAAAVLHDGL